MSHHCRSHAAGPSRARVIEAIVRFHRKCLERYGASIGADARRALQSILACRTEAMGGRHYHCDKCGCDHFAWHSCNHRLCPQCGAAETAEWVASKLRERLRVPHFMVTFTLPGQLRALCRGDTRGAFLRLFFGAASRAVKEVLANPRHLGGQCGFFAMLQTWTQDLRQHPHIHFVVPAVALDRHGRIRRARDPKWLARGDVFAARLRTLLLKAIRDERLLGEDAIEALWRIGWNCDVQNLGSGENAMKYLGAYVCKGPICDSRILEIGEDTVTFSVKNRDTGRCETVELDGAEFVRRYLQHALPARFHRIRYHGFLHARAKSKLQSIRDQLGMPRPSNEEQPQPDKPTPTIACPRCGSSMRLSGLRARAPPHLRSFPHIWNRKPPVAA